MMLLAFLLAALQTSAAPAWQGPGLLCGATFSIQLEPGEIGSPISGGIHQRSAVLRTAGGDLIYQEFESLIARGDPGPGLPLASGFVAHRSESDGQLRYTLLQGRGVRLILSGSALNGSEGDRALLERIRNRPEDGHLCTYSYRYD